MGIGAFRFGHSSKGELDREVLIDVAPNHADAEGSPRPHRVSHTIAVRPGGVVIGTITMTDSNRLTEQVLSVV